MENSYKKYLLKGGFWAALGFMLKTILQVSVAIILPRVLLPSTLADYYLVASLVPVVAITSSFGLPQVLLKLIPRIKSTTSGKGLYLFTMRFIGVSTLITIVISGILYSLDVRLYRLFFSVLYDYKVTLLILAWIWVEVVLAHLRASQQAIHNQRAIMLYADVLPQVVIVVVLLFFLQAAESSLFYILLLVLVGVGLSLITMFVDYKARVDEVDDSATGKGEQMKTGKELISMALPFWGITIALMVLNKFDIWVIGYFLKPEDVAIYGTALKLILFVSIVFHLINSVTIPIISELYKQGSLTQLSKIVRIGASIASIPAFLLFLLFVFFGHQVLTLMFGAFYAGGYHVLVLLALSQFLNIVTGCSGTVLMYTNYHGLMMKITLASGVLMVLLSMLLIDSFGMLGVAYANLIAMTIQNIFMAYFVKLKLNIWTFVSINHFNRTSIKAMIKAVKSQN